MRAPLRERAAQRRPVAEQVLLADDLVDRCWPHPHGERRLARRHPGPRARRTVVGSEELAFHRPSIATPSAGDSGAAQNGG